MQLYMSWTILKDTNKKLKKMLDVFNNTNLGFNTTLITLHIFCPYEVLLVFCRLHHFYIQLFEMGFVLFVLLGYQIQAAW